MSKASVLTPTCVFRVLCERPLTTEFTRMDVVLQRLVGRQSDGSGAGFGVRDMEWNFKSEAAARRAYAKLARRQGLRVVLSIQDENSGEEIDLLP